MNSYNFAHLDFNRKDCVVFLRSWSDKRTESIRDIESYVDEGYCEFPTWRMAINQRSHPPPVRSISMTPSLLGEHFEQQPPRGSPLVTISVSSESSLHGSRYSSIQAAVDAARPNDTITVEASTYDENIHIDKSVTIIGKGATVTIINGNSNGSVLTVGRNNSDIDVELRAISLRGGKGSSTEDPWRATGAWRTVISGGGGILNYGRLKIENSEISNNYAYEGGGIYNHGALILDSSTVCSNKASFFGGGIVNIGMLTLNSGKIWTMKQSRAAELLMQAS